jgi:hypothetical protein
VRYDPTTGVFTRRSTSKWHARAEGREINTRDTDGYVVIRIDGVMYKAHRLAWMWMTGAMPAVTIDHANRQTADNRFINLREATTKQNNENRGRPKNNKSGIVGVRKMRYGKWRAYIYHNKQNLYLGEYDQQEHAIAARQQAVGRLFTHASAPPAAT